MHGSVAMCTSVGTLLYLVTQLVMVMVEHSVYSVAMCTSEEMPGLAVIQLRLGCVPLYKKAISACSTTSLNLDGNCSFTNCSATNDGGAIHTCKRNSTTFEWYQYFQCQ